MCHSVTSMEPAGPFIPQNYRSRDDAMQCNMYIIGMSELLSDGSGAHVSSHYQTLTNDI